MGCCNSRQLPTLSSMPIFSQITLTDIEAILSSAFSGDVDTLLTTMRRLKLSDVSFIQCHQFMYDGYMINPFLLAVLSNQLEVIKTLVETFNVPVPANWDVSRKQCCEALPMSLEIVIKETKSLDMWKYLVGLETYFYPQQVPLMLEACISINWLDGFQVVIQSDIFTAYYYLLLTQGRNFFESIYSLIPKKVGKQFKKSLKQQFKKSPFACGYIDYMLFKSEKIKVKALQEYMNDISQRDTLIYIKRLTYYQGLEYVRQKENDFLKSYIARLQVDQSEYHHMLEKLIKMQIEYAIEGNLLSLKQTVAQAATLPSFAQSRGYNYDCFFRDEINEDTTPWTPFHFAIAFGNLNIVKYYIEERKVLGNTIANIDLHLRFVKEITDLELRPSVQMFVLAIHQKDPAVFKYLYDQIGYVLYQTTFIQLLQYLKDSYKLGTFVKHIFSSRITHALFSRQSYQNRIEFIQQIKDTIFSKEKEARQFLQPQPFTLASMRSVPIRSDPLSYIVHISALTHLDMAMLKCQDKEFVADLYVLKDEVKEEEKYLKMAVELLLNKF